MNFHLTIEADTLEELLDVLRPRSNQGGGLVLPAYIDMPLKEAGIDSDEEPESDRPKVNYTVALSPEESEEAVENVKAEQEAAAKPRRGRPPKTKAEEPKLEPEKAEYTLDDVKAAVSKLLDSGDATGAQVREMLVNTFGVQSFGQLAPAQYPDVIGEVQNLAA